MTNDREMHVEDLLPAYANRTLDARSVDLVERHVAHCTACASALAEWQCLAGLMRTQRMDAPAPDLLERALARIDRRQIEISTTLPPSSPRAYVREHVRAIGVGIWAGSMFGISAALLVAWDAGDAGQARHALATIVPLVAAFGTAFAAGSSYRGTAEAPAQSAPSQRTTVLIRTALVLGFDLLLAVLASIALTVVFGDWWSFVAAWLGPMLLLGAVAMLVSLIIRPSAGAASACGLCVVRGAVAVIPGVRHTPLAEVARLWRTDPFVLGLACVLLVVAAIALPRLRGRRLA